MSKVVVLGLGVEILKPWSVELKEKSRNWGFYIIYSLRMWEIDRLTWRDSLVAGLCCCDSFGSEARYPGIIISPHITMSVSAGLATDDSV